MAIGNYIVTWVCRKMKDDLAQVFRPGGHLCFYNLPDCVRIGAIVQWMTCTERPIQSDQFELAQVACFTEHLRLLGPVIYLGRQTGVSFLFGSLVNRIFFLDAICIIQTSYCFEVPLE